MKNCASVEMLVYLYREGELTPEERSRLLEHLASCSRCRELQGELLAMEAALRPARERVPAFSIDAGTAKETIRRIELERENGYRAPSRMPSLELLVRWLRPGLSFAVVVLAVLFLVQQSRDAAQLSELDARLRERGAQRPSGPTFLPPMGARSLLFIGDQSVRMPWTPPRIASAAPGGDLLAAYGLGLGDLFGHRRGLFEELSRRYPNLSTVNPDDGIDERERTILATEGKSLINELERMIREGEIRQ